MALFALGDTHLSIGIDKPMDIFGDRWKDHTKKIEKGWNAVVKEDDTVIVCGDISWASSLEEAGADLKFIDALNGKKLILRGNHDYWWSTISKINNAFCDLKISTIEILQNNAYLKEGRVICAARGWFNDKKLAPADIDYSKLIQREVGRLRLSLEAGAKLALENGIARSDILVFLHFPPVFGDCVCREMIDLLHEYDIHTCYYGHVHNVYNIARCFEYEGIKLTIVSADYLGFVPLIL